jgi:hypothetical protein
MLYMPFISPTWALKTNISVGDNHHRPEKVNLCPGPIISHYWFGGSFRTVCTHENVTVLDHPKSKQKQWQLGFGIPQPGRLTDLNWMKNGVFHFSQTLYSERSKNPLLKAAQP